MSVFKEYSEYDALGLAELVRNGEVSAQELLGEAKERLSLINTRFNAVTYQAEKMSRSLIENLDNLDGKIPHWKLTDQYFEDYYGIEALTDSANDSDDIYFEYDITDWFCVCSLDELGVSLQMSEEEIKSRAKLLYEESEYPLQGDEEDVFEYLLQRVIDEREDD